MDEPAGIFAQARDRAAILAPAEFGDESGAEGASEHLEPQRQALIRWMDLSKDSGEWE